MLYKPKHILVLAVSLLIVGGVVSLLRPHPDTSLPPVNPPAPSQPQAGGRVSTPDDRSDSAPYQHQQTGKPSPTSSPDRVASAIPKPAVYDEARVEQFITINNKQYPLRVYEPLLTPNDPQANQWWVTNSTLSQAWDTPAGNNETLLAVIDTGFALQHEEFTDRWFMNTGEQGVTTQEEPSQLNCSDRGLALNANCNLVDDDGDGEVDEESGSISYQNPSRLNCTAQNKPLDKACNRIDDDANDFVDDVTGWDFANFDNSTQAGEINPSGIGTTHGSRVAGVAAAAGNNAKGIAGSDWQTKLLPLQALDDNAYGDTYGVGRAILYAASMGADVISLSLGSDLPDEYVRETIRIASQAGSLVVASAGNDGCDCMVYPAHYPEVLSVGALDTNNAPASFSSYGADLDILAPGTGITTTSWSAANPTSAYASNVAGTSYSTPLVSGLLTRLLSQRPTATPLQLIAALTENTNRLTLPATANRSNTLGFGKLDAQKATSRVTSPKADAISHRLAPVSTGATLDPANPLELPGNYYPVDCAGSTPGTTPIFELTKGDRTFFTISQVEVWSAQQNGYTSNLLTNACLSQPHDTPGTVRNINIPREFRNAYGH